MDLYLQDGHDPNGLSNLVEFPSANGDGRLLPSRRQPLKEPDTETISEHSQTEVLLTESQKRNFEKNKTRRLSKGSSKNPNESLNGDESSPLLSACSSAHKIDGTNTGQNSPALETKVNLTSNLFEYYLPKHDDEWTSGLNQGFKRKNILQYPNPEEETAAKEMNGNGRGEQGAMLTFHRSSLDASADNFSLLTPSSSISTTPINALVKSNSIGDTTADQCSSSMSSGSSNPPSDSKVSPVNLYASQHLYANTGPASCLSSFGYGTVGAHNGTSHFNGKDTIVVSKKNRTTSNSKPTETVINGDQQQQQAKPKPALPSSTQTTYV